jgi:hypothetical protein
MLVRGEAYRIELDESESLRLVLFSFLKAVPCV